MPEAPIEVWHGITRLVRGGAQGVVLDLLAGLDRGRFRPVLLSGEETGSEGSLWPEAEALGIELIRIPTLVRAVSPWNDVRTLRHLTRLLRERRPAIVHAHTSKAGFLLCRAARRAKIAGIVFSPHGHIAGASAEIPGVPKRGIKRRILSQLARQSARDAHVVVCPNDAERRDGIAHRMWTEQRSIVVPNGIDTDRFEPAPHAAACATIGIDARIATIGVVARLTREKGVDLAITALAEIPEAQLVIVGDGPERAALETLTIDYEVADRVTFLGMRDDVASLYPAFDVLAVPSRTEAHGLVAAEALSCEVPVIAARVGGLQSIVESDRCGAFFPPGNATALATALTRVLEDRPWAERLGRAGRRLVLERWSRRAMLSGTEELYLKLLPTGAGLPAPDSPPPSLSRAESPAQSPPH
mgnify:CR=1 FL=1